MKILSVTGILPIPGLIKDNDIIFQIYDHYKESYPDTEVEIIRIIPYSNFFLSKIKSKWKDYYEAIKMGEYSDRGYRITIFPHIIFKAKENVFTFLAKATYYQNFFKARRYADVDIVHAQQIFSDGALAYKIAQKFSKPLIITVRRQIKYFNNSYAEKRANKILESASFITTPSPNTYSFLKNRYPEKTYLIAHGISQRFFSEQKISSCSKVKILTVAKFWEYKNITNVIVALSKLKKEHNFKYQIIGDGYHRTVIEECIKKHNMEDYVEMKAHVSHKEIPKVYEEADIFVMVSYPETFGRVYFEAMAAGVPIICAKNSGIHGLFEEGVSGFSVEHEDSEALEEILSRLIDNQKLRKSVGKRGQELVANYDWPTINDQYQALYSKALERST